MLTADGAGDLPATRRSPREPGVHVLSASYPDAADPGVAVVSTTIEVTAPPRRRRACWSTASQ